MTDLISPLIPSFERSLRARRRSAKTIKSYCEAARQFAAHQAANGANLDPALVTRGEVEDFIADQLERWSPSTAATRYRCLAQFWNWAEAEGEVTESPMAKMSPPSLPEEVVPVLGDDQIKALLAACEGTSFHARRDAAIIRLFLATGIRLGEMVGITTDDIDLDQAVVLVTGKGDRARWVSYDPRTTAALDRYERQRRRHPRAAEAAWWLGPKGGLTDSGITQLIRRRARDAGIGHLHPHMFRHTFRHRWLAAGGTEGALQELAGWRSAQMLARYGRSARSERARAEYGRVDVMGDL